jgi:hypothetical protein
MTLPENSVEIRENRANASDWVSHSAGMEPGYQ